MFDGEAVILGHVRGRGAGRWLRRYNVCSRWSADCMISSACGVFFLISRTERPSHFPYSAG